MQGKQRVQTKHAHMSVIYRYYPVSTVMPLFPFALPYRGWRGEGAICSMQKKKNLDTATKHEKIIGISRGPSVIAYVFRFKIYCTFGTLAKV